MVPAEGFTGGTVGEWHGREGGPATQEGTAEGGGFVLQPVQPMREGVLAGPGQAVGDPDCVADHATALCDEVCQRPPRGTLGREGGQLIAVGAQECELAVGSSGGIFRVAGGAGLAGPGEGERMDGEPDEALVCAQRGDHGPLGECQAHSARLASGALAQGPAPLVNGCRRVVQDAGRSFVGVRGLEAESMSGIGPIGADESGAWLVQ
jgi:hypothetical protein